MEPLQNLIPFAPVLAASAADVTGSGTSLVEAFAEKGTLGLVIIALLIVIRQLYSELKDERKARLDDSKLYTESVLSLNTKLHAALSEISRLADYFERRHNP